MRSAPRPARRGHARRHPRLRRGAGPGRRRPARAPRHLGQQRRRLGGEDDPASCPRPPTTIFRNQLELNLTAAFQGAKAAANRMESGRLDHQRRLGRGHDGGAEHRPLRRGQGRDDQPHDDARRRSWRPSGIRVNAISPGMVPTEAFHQVLGITEAELPAVRREGAPRAASAHPRTWPPRWCTSPRPPPRG